MTFLLSLMAVVISVQSYRSTKLQTQVALLQAMPRFDVVFNQQYDGFKQKYTDNEVNIYNRGGSFTNFSSSDVVVLEVKYMGKDFTEKHLQVFVYGYFTAEFVSPSSSQGLLAQFTGNNNNLKKIDLEQGIGKYAKSHGLEYALIDVKQYVRMRYKDILGEDQTQYYDIPCVGPAEPIDIAKGKTVFKDYDDAAKDGRLVDFEKLTLEQLGEKLS